MIAKWKEVQNLKKEKKALIKDIGLSVREYKKNLPKVKGYGDDFKVLDVDVSHVGAHVPSLYQQVLILRKLKEINDEFKDFALKNKPPEAETKAET